MVQAFYSITFVAVTNQDKLSTSVVHYYFSINFAVIFFLKNIYMFLG